MKRTEYLNIENFVVLHEFVNSLIQQAENNSEEYLTKKGYKTHLLEKKISSGRILKDDVVYNLAYTFFEDFEDVHLKENYVTLTFTISVLAGNHFNIETTIESVYELKEYTKYYNITELNSDAQVELSHIPIDFQTVLKSFFEKALDRFGNPDDMHSGVLDEENSEQLL